MITSAATKIDERPRPFSDVRKCIPNKSLADPVVIVRRPGTANKNFFISLTSLQGGQLACHGCVALCLVGACRRRTPAPAHDEDRGDEDHHTPDADPVPFLPLAQVPLRRP